MFADRIRTGIDWTPGADAGDARSPEPVALSGVLGAGGIRAAIRARGGGGSGVRGGGRIGFEPVVGRTPLVCRISGSGSDSGGGELCL